MLAFKTIVEVRLDGRIIGWIKKATDGWYYDVKGGGAGESFKTIEECKQSLRG